MCEYTKLDTNRVNKLDGFECRGISNVSTERWGVAEEGTDVYVKLFFRGDLDPREQKFSFRHYDHQPADWKDGYCQLREVWQIFHYRWTHMLREGKEIQPTETKLWSLTDEEPIFELRLSYKDIHLYNYRNDWVLQAAFRASGDVPQMYKDLKQTLDYMYNRIGEEGRSREAQDERLEANELQGLARDTTDSYFSQTVEDRMIEEASEYAKGHFVPTYTDREEELTRRYRKEAALYNSTSDNNNVDRENLPF